MAVIRLIPSSYSVSNSSYLSVTNPENMYANTDSTTYGQAYNSRTGTSSYYLYLTGFNFDDIPSGAIVNSFSIKLKGYESGVSTSSQYAPVVMASSAQGGDPGGGGAPPGEQDGNLGTFSNLSTSAQVLTATMTADWATVYAAGSNLTIRIDCRRASRNTAAYAYIYGAEVYVDYTMPVSATVTSTLTGNGTISPSGATITYEGATYTLTITPDDLLDTVTATKDGTDITSSIVAHYPGGTVSTVLGTYTLVSGGFNGQGATYFQGIVGNGVDATQTTSNYYSSGSGTNAVFNYALAFDIPSNATIEACYVEVNGHAESTSNSSEYMCVQIISGETTLSDQVNFKDYGTSNQTITVTATTLPTVAQANNLSLQCTLGYYGGAINGATCYITYSVPGNTPEYYTYTYTVDGDATIAVTIGSGSGSSPTIYLKINGSWVQYSKVYIKQNGSWVEQSNISNVFDSNANYVKGN